MLVGFSIVPVGQGESIGDLVAEVIRIVERSKLPYRLTPMGTVVQGNWDEVMALLKKCHHKALSKGRRVMTHISIDDRKGARNPIQHKIESVERRIGHQVCR